jgi:hypothetical protein
MELHTAVTFTLDIWRAHVEGAGKDNAEEVSMVGCANAHACAAWSPPFFFSILRCLSNSLVTKYYFFSFIILELTLSRVIFI